MNNLAHATCVSFLRPYILGMLPVPTQMFSGQFTIFIRSRFDTFISRLEDAKKFSLRSWLEIPQINIHPSLPFKLQLIAIT
jgi:hypothetical protein